MFRYGLILMTICLSAALVLSTTYKFTKPKIEAQMIEEEMAALKEIFPEAGEFRQDSTDGQDFYLVEIDGKVLGYVIKVKAKGYASDIDMLVGIDLKGIIKGVIVTSQNETPGLGAKVIEVKQDEDKPWFLKQFEGKRAANLNLQNIDAITAATITSEAVIDSVKNEITKFLNKVK